MVEPNSEPDREPALLALRGARFGYVGLSVVHDLDFTLREGECVALLGRNGMGKTTLLRGMAGWNDLQAGSRWWRGADASKRPARKLAADGLLLLPEDRGIFTTLTVRENLELAERTRGVAARTLDMFPELRPRLGNRGGSLSGGERQMLALARAIAAEPRLLLLDETTEGLSPRVAERVWQLLENFRAQRLSMVVVDKNWRRAARLADRVLILSRGRVVVDSSGADLLANGALAERHLSV